MSQTAVHKLATLYENWQTTETQAMLFPVATAHFREMHQAFEVAKCSRQGQKCLFAFRTPPSAKSCENSELTNMWHVLHYTEQQFFQPLDLFLLPAQKNMGAL